MNKIVQLSYSSLPFTTIWSSTWNWVQINSCDLTVEEWIHLILEEHEKQRGESSYKMCQNHCFGNLFFKMNLAGRCTVGVNCKTGPVSRRFPVQPIEPADLIQFWKQCPKEYHTIYATCSNVDFMRNCTYSGVAVLHYSILKSVEWENLIFNGVITW